MHSHKVLALGVLSLALNACSQDSYPEANVSRADDLRQELLGSSQINSGSAVVSDLEVPPAADLDRSPAPAKSNPAPSKAPAQEAELAAPVISAPVLRVSGGMASASPRIQLPSDLALPTDDNDVGEATVISEGLGSNPRTSAEGDDGEPSVAANGRVGPAIRGGILIRGGGSGDDDCELHGPRGLPGPVSGAVHGNHGLPVVRAPRSGGAMVNNRLPTSGGGGIRGGIR